MVRSRFLLVAPLALMLFGGTAAAQRVAGLAIRALGLVEHGQWELRPRSGGPVLRSVCLGDPATLIALRHPGAGCSRYLIENERDRVTVHYTCPGAGHGRTTIRVETPRLISLDTQGIADNAPFDLSFEGRRVGSCAAQH